MSDEPTLPRLPGPPFSPMAYSSSPLGPGRKRARLSYPPPSSSFSSSSDPAIFSSDDDPALDNYVQGGRRKKRYVGTWYDQRPASSDSANSSMASSPVVNRALPKPAKRQFKRQMDSGVWLGPDLTDTDESVILEPKAPRLPLVAPVSPRQKLDRHQERAQARVLDCLERGAETVDLR